MSKARADLFPRKLVSKDCHKPEGAGHIGRTCLSKNSPRSESFIETETIGVLWETYSICFSHSKPNSKGRTMKNATSTKAAIKYIELWGLRLEARCSKHRPLRLAWYNQQNYFTVLDSSSKSSKLAIIVTKSLVFLFVWSLDPLLSVFHQTSKFLVSAFPMAMMPQLRFRQLVLMSAPAPPATRKNLTLWSWKGFWDESKIQELQTQDWISILSKWHIHILIDCSDTCTCVSETFDCLMC